MAKEEVNFDTLWIEGVDLLLNDYLKESVAKFRRYFREVRTLQEEEYLVIFNEKKTKIMNLLKSISRKKPGKYCLRFLRSMIKIYKSFDDENLIEEIFMMSIKLIHMLDYTEDKLQEIETVKKFLIDYGEEGPTLLDLTVMEVELKLKMGMIEDSMITVLEVISEVSNLMINMEDDEFDDERAKDEYIDLMKAYVKLSEIYQKIGDERKAFRAVQKARRSAESLSEDHPDRENLIAVCDDQQVIVLNDGPTIDIEPDTPRENLFNMNESVKRLHLGLGGKKRGTHYDCVPNGVFVKENPFVREMLYKYTDAKGWPEKSKNMDVAMYRLLHGRKEADLEMIIHDQPFKNYPRDGFLPHNHFGYKPKDYPKCSIGNSPYYKEGAMRDRIEQIHNVKPKPIKIDSNVGTISADNKRNYDNKMESARQSRAHMRASHPSMPDGNTTGGRGRGVKLENDRKRRLDLLDNL